jgi:hypothetical protein
MAPVLASLIDDVDSTETCFTVNPLKPACVDDSVIMPKPQLGPQGERKAQRWHSVDFAGEHTVIEVEKHNVDMKDDIWYSREEYHIIKARNSIIVRMMKTGRFEESDEHSFRGLEHKLKDGYRQRRANKFNALNAVLEEQDRQFAQGVRDSENIAQKYEEVAVWAREMAFVLAVKDSEDSFSNGYTDSQSCGGRVVRVGNDDDAATEVSDLDTLASEDTNQKKMRIRQIFGRGFSFSRSKARRRASM